MGARSNLRARSSKEAFRIIAQASCELQSFENDTRGARFWTKKTVEEAVRLVVKKNKICPPTGPGFDWDTWFKDQSKVIHQLCRRAARNRLATMDELQTVPFDQEDRFNCCCSFSCTNSKYQICKMVSSSMAQFQSQTAAPPVRSLAVPNEPRKQTNHSSKATTGNRAPYRRRSSTTWFS